MKVVVVLLLVRFYLAMIRLGPRWFYGLPVVVLFVVGVFVVGNENIFIFCTSGTVNLINGAR